MNKSSEEIYFWKGNLTPGASLSLPRDNIYVYDHYFQRYFPLKPHGLSKQNFMWSLLGKRGHKFCNNGVGPYMAKTVKIFFSRTVVNSLTEFCLNVNKTDYALS